MLVFEEYSPDRSLKGKIRRRLVRLAHRKPATVNLARPMVSFSFDDAPTTAARAGARILEARGLRGTYFMSAMLEAGVGPMGPFAPKDDAIALLKNGHEIACHTYSHMDCGSSPAEAVEADVNRNVAELAAWGAPTPETFAYPYGDVSHGAKAALARRYGLLRALHKGLIEKGTDLHQAPAVGIEGPDGEKIALAWLEKAISRKAWIILYTHDVEETPSPWGCTPGALERLADRALAAGCDVVTVAEGLKRISLNA